MKPTSRVIDAMRGWIALMMIGLSAIGQEPAVAQRELIYLNWREYSDTELMAAFETRFHAKIREVLFQSEDERDRLLVEQQGKGFDIVNVSERVTEGYVKLGWLEKLDPQLLPNLKHVDPRFMAIRKEIQGYVAPNMWGTIGIGYRRDLVHEPITSWKQLFQPAEYLKGKIFMLHDTLEVTSLVFRALGYTPNDYNQPQALRRVEEVLLQQRPYVRAYGVLHSGTESLLVSSEIVMVLAWNGDVRYLREKEPNIAYVVPDEGTNLWVDFHAILSGSRNRLLAYQFIDFLQDPVNAARLSQTFSYAPTNKAALQYLPPEFLQDPIIFPPAAVLEKSAFLPRLPPRTKKAWNQLFSNIHAP